MDADTTSPTVVINSDANTPVAGSFPIAIASEPVSGFELEDLVVGNGSASQLQGSQASYTATITPGTSGTVTVDIADRAAYDNAGNPSAAADQFSIPRRPDSGAGSAGRRRDRACRAVAPRRRAPLGAELTADPG